MKLASLFDGIGGWPLAAVRNGIEPVWASEVERFPIEVTKVRFPWMKNLGSVTDIKWDEVEPVDIITSGSPCQDLSVAGLRKGLEGERSGLFYDSIRLVRRMRSATGGKFPKFYVWENVSGAFSSNKGRDFLAVLEALTEANLPMPRSGRWANAGMVRSRVCDCAWRTLDAQHWGVAQRRRRIFLVADFRAVGQRRPEVFFESESLPGNHQAGKGAWQGSAEAADGCFSETGGCLTPWDVQSRKIFDTEGKMQSLYAGQGGGRGCSIFAIAGNTIDRQPKNGGNGKGFQQGVSYTLTAMDRHAVAIRERCGCEGGGKGLLYGDDMAHTLATSNDQFVMQKTVGALCADDHKGINNQYVNQGKVVVGSLCSHYARSCQDNQSVQSGHVIPQNGVRRLTPLECERLQGLPEVISFLDFNFENLTLEFKSCLDLQREPVLNVAEKCLKLQRPVGTVERISLRELAQYAERNTFIKHQQKSKPVLVIVHTNLGDLEAEKHRGKKSRSNVFSAESHSLCLHQKITTLLVQLIVGIDSIVEKTIPDGREESLLKGKILTIHGNGKIVLNEFGKEMARSVKDAVSIKPMIKRLLRHITSSHSQIKQLELTLITLFFYVVSAITGFTQEKTPIRTLLEIHSGYTLIPHKSCSDSARYKAIGNGMAQPCADYVLSVVKRMAE